MYTEKKAAKDQRFDPIFLLLYSAFLFTNLFVSPGH